MNTNRFMPIRLGLLFATALVCSGTAATADTEGPLADYIVTIKGEPGHGSAEASRQLLSRYGGTARFVYEHVVAGYAAAMTTTQARQVAADPTVTAVTPDTASPVTNERNGTTSESPADKTYWHLDRINQLTPQLDNNTDIGRTGKGVTIYVLDDGIRTSHKEFEERASIGTVTTGEAAGAGCLHHGTGVASMAAGHTMGVAKAAKVVSVRGVHCNGTARVSEMVAAVDWITRNANRPAVVNMSNTITERIDSAQLLHDAVRKSIANGLTYVAAAGNFYGNACEWLPARVPEAITVGATEIPGLEARGTRKVDSLPDWSNWGKCVDLLAPGSNLTVASATNDKGYVTGSLGTSFSAPMVAGAAALYLEEHPDAPPAEVANALIRQSTKDRVQVRRPQTPNRLLYVEPEKTGRGAR